GRVNHLNALRADMARHGHHSAWEHVSAGHMSWEREGTEPATEAGHCVAGEPRVKPAHSDLLPTADWRQHGPGGTEGSKTARYDVLCVERRRDSRDGRPGG